ncbi:hypothetical protein [Endozoicomonas sp. 4G]|uniref:hypothetical protein n=1 Tax=Endozoicomonas sp. 4G TaxID=2872754 RepID=UPI002078F2D2|nr:hypothetical protein [Endozoicomonas sp. 4G]
MPKIYRLAILASTTAPAHTNTVVRYTRITACSHKEARALAKKLNALVCGWRVAA